MKKTALFLAAIMLLSVVAFASCDKLPFFGPEDTSCSHVDRDGDLVCDLCRGKLEATETPSCEHKNENMDHRCDKCGEIISQCADTDDHYCDICGNVVMKECIDADKDHVCEICGKSSACADPETSHGCDYCGKVFSECHDDDKNHLCDVCDKALSECADPETTHGCNYCGKVFSECADGNGDFSCDLCGKEMVPEGMERLYYFLDAADLETGVPASDLISGKFTIVSGTEIRNRAREWVNPDDATDTRSFTKSVKFGATANQVKVSVPGSGTLVFWAQNGSSSADTQKVKIVSPDGTEKIIEFDGNNSGSPVVKITVNVTEGEWSIFRGQGNTVDIYAFELTCVAEISEEVGFELVSAGNVDFLCGQTLDLSGIRLNATYGNGKTEPLANDAYSVDSSAVNLAVSGTYPVVISYKEYAPITINVNVYQPESVILGIDAIEKLAQNSSAGNGVYFNHSLREVYAVGDELDLTGLSVIVKGTLGESSLEFRVGSQYTVNQLDLSTAGEKTLTVSYVFGENSISANFSIYVVDTAPAIVEDVYRVKVDQSYDGVIGANVGDYNMFNTIQQALDFLKKADANKLKVMIINPGLYTEKLEITIPYLHIKGAGADKVTIEWNSLYGLVDAGGFTHTTDSTQTVAVREQAHHVTIEGVTISNWFNSQERMNESGLEIERGLALLVMSDSFIMKDSALLGIQDTLELFYGRQYFENVFISGYTDFIFGTNNTTYFKNCTIHVIYTNKVDKGTAGYLTAFKGSNKGENDAVTYGAIFDGCKFTADERVTAGTTAIGRTWGAYAAVAILNSELGGHISTSYTDGSKNQRYISMNGILPSDERVQFVEYNNTGAGALTEAIAAMKMLTAEEAALYTDFAVIFDKINRNVTYLDPWNPEITEIIVDDRDYYHFTTNTSSSGINHSFDTTTTIAKGETLEWDGLLISAENGNVAWNQNAGSLNMKAGAFVKFNVKAGTVVDIETHSGYAYFTINGVGTSSGTGLSRYFAEDTEVVILSTGDLYLRTIIINPYEDAPTEATLKEIKVSGLNLNYTVGDELGLADAEVKAYYSDNSVITLTDYSVDHSAVNNAAAGSYDVVFTYGGMSATVTVTYEDPNADPAITDSILLDFKTPDALAAVQNNPRVTMTGSIRHNGGEIQIKGTISFMVKAGSVVTVIPYNNTSYVSYTIGMEGATNLTTYTEGVSVVFNKDCTVVYTGLDNNYLVGIKVECPVKGGKYVFGGSGESGDVTGILASGNNINISGTCKTHNGGAQLGQDSLISFTLPAFSNLTIKGYDTSYGQLEVYVGETKLEMNSSACYVYSAIEPAAVTIKAVNVGTEESPAFNKSYITYIDITLKKIFDENTTINLGGTSGIQIQGTVGEFEGLEVDATNGKFASNGDWMQVNQGTIVTLIVAENAKVSVKSYQNAENYAIEIEDGVCTITCTASGYWGSITVNYPHVFKENTTVNLGGTSGIQIQGAIGEFEGIEVDATNGKFASNGDWMQVNQGTILRLNVLDGAQVSVKSYQNAENYAIEIADGVCTITCTASGYWGSITITY